MTWFQKNSVLTILLIFIGLTLFFFSVFSGKDYVNFADYFASIILLFALLLSIFIYLSNSHPFFNRIFGRVANFIIKTIPDDIPFGKKIKSYLKNLLKINKRVVIFLPYVNETNREAVFLQLLGFLTLLERDNSLEEDIKKDFKLKGLNYEVEIVFIKVNSDDISYYFTEELNQTDEYVIITGMSEVYRDAIFSKKLLIKEIQERIKIVGALSSISTDIENIVNDDEDIIRVFPPDYDESEKAISFMMSRIKNNICHNHECDFKNKKSNIIVLHAREYGEAVRLKCKEFFELEMKNIYKNTNTSLNTLELEESISFYSFRYNNDNFIYDFIEDNSFDKYIDMWKETESTNYFFLVGYEPNISNMLNLLSPKIENMLTDICFLFSSPVSLEQWRERVNNTIKKYSFLGDDNYYISTQSYDNDQKYINIQEIKKDYKNFKVKKISNGNEIIDIVFNDLFNMEMKDKEIQFIELEKEINKFQKNNFVSNFAKLGIEVAREYIKTEKSLLISKQKVFEKNGITLKLLMNGDSINNFEISLINYKRKENKNEK